MQLSNKILIGFFAFGFLYLTAVFAEVRFRGTPNVIDDTNSIAETVDIPGVSYLVLEDLDKSIEIIGSDQARLEVRSFSGDFLHRLEHNISGDTLTVRQLRSEDVNTARITVFVPKASLTGMTVKKAVAIVKGLQRESFSLSQVAGRIWMSDNTIASIHTEAFDQSYLDISAQELDTLSLKIDNSEVVVSSPLGLLRGSMGNVSHLRMNAVNEIQFKKDATSKLNMWE